MEPLTAPEHEGVNLLLPWWVNGTLSAEERAQVAAHLAVCAACRAEERRCVRLAEACRGEADLAPSPHPERIERLLEDAAATSPPLRRARSRRAALALPLAAGLILALVGFWRFGGQAEPADPVSPGTFRTLADASSATAAGQPARGVRVVFAPETREMTMREILLSVRGRIVGGPSPLGAYTVELPAGANDDPISVVLEHLRSRPEVRLAEPLATPTS